MLFFLKVDTNRFAQYSSFWRFILSFQYNCFSFIFIHSLHFVISDFNNIYIYIAWVEMDESQISLYFKVNFEY